MSHDSRLAGRVPVLDGVRGLAICSVMLFHAAPALGLHGPLELVAGFGWAGVDLFFVLSGFLITSGLLTTRGQPGYFRRFYGKRTRRIVPLYALYVLVLACLMPGDWLPWYATWTTNIRIALANSWAVTVGGTAFFWSLCVEEQFYAVWPAIVGVLTDRRLIRLCLALVAMAFAVRVWATATDHLFAAYVLLPARMDALALGALAAVIAQREGGVDWLAARAALALPLVVVGLAALVGATHYAGWDNPFMATVGYSLNAAAGVSLLELAVAGQDRTRLARVLAFRPLRYAGQRCYGLYVLSGVGGLMATALGATGRLEALASVAITFLLAEASWRFLEEPIISRRRRVGHVEVAHR